MCPAHSSAGYRQRKTLFDQRFDSVSYNISHTGIKSFRHNIIFAELFIRYETGDSQRGSQLHFFGDLGSTSFQCAAEDTRESDYIIYLVREVTAACTYDTCAGSLGFIDELFTTLLGKRRSVEAAALAVVLRSKADIGVHDGFLDEWDHLLLPWLNHDGLGIRSCD